MIDHFKAAGLVPRYHGNGFTQLYLNEDHRLHVWHPLLPASEDNNAQIHDHIWPMSSQVLVGQLAHLTYDVRTDISQYDMYEINQPAVRKNDDDVFKFLDTAAALNTGNYLMQTGSIYHFAPGQFHQSLAANLAATLIRKGADVLESPRLLCTSGEPPYQAFGEGSQPPENDMWEAIKEAVALMPEIVTNHLVKMVPINDNSSKKE